MKQTWYLHFAYIKSSAKHSLKAYDTRIELRSTILLILFCKTKISIRTNNIISTFKLQSQYIGYNLLYDLVAPKGAVGFEFVEVR